MILLGILQVMQNVSLRAAVLAPYSTVYIGIANVVFSQADCDNSLSLSALHWWSFIHKSLSWTIVLQVKQLLLLFPHRSEVCTQEERERWSQALGTCSSATSIDNTKYAQHFGPQPLSFSLSCHCHFKQTCDRARLLWYPINFPGGWSFNIQ